jgi:hypothetical protein
MSSNDEPVLLEIMEVKMYNPTTNEDRPIKRADFEGISDIFENEQVEELRSDGWFTRGIGAKIAYKDRIYKVTVSGNSKLGYVKVEDIADMEIGRELHQIIRNRYLDNFRIHPEVQGL